MLIACRFRAVWDVIRKGSPSILSEWKRQARGVASDSGLDSDDAFFVSREPPLPTPSYVCELRHLSPGSSCWGKVTNHTALKINKLKQWNLVYAFVVLFQFLRRIHVLRVSSVEVSLVTWWQLYYLCPWPILPLSLPIELGKKERFARAGDLRSLYRYRRTEMRLFPSTFFFCSLVRRTSSHSIQGQQHEGQFVAILVYSVLFTFLWNFPKIER